MSKQNKIFSIHASIVNIAVLCVKIYGSLGVFTVVASGRGMSSPVSDLLV